MDEVDLVRALLPEQPGPTATATQQAQARLSAGIARARRSRGRPWWRRRTITIPVLAAVAAAAVAAVILAVLPTTRPGNDQAAVLADHAVAATATQPVIPQGQWVYQKVVAKRPDGTIRTGVSWIRTGTGEMAVTGPDQAGFASGYGVPYRDFARLPSQPQALIKYLASLPGSGGSDEDAFLTIEGTLIDGAPPAVAAKLYRALGAIPGVTVDTNAVDVAGRHGVAFARGGEQIILAKSTYRFMGFVTDDAAGHLLDGEAILQRTPVSGAFVIP
jgi:hypothetical protein